MVWLLLLLQAAAIVSAFDQQVLDLNGPGQDGPRAQEQGSHLVDAAMAELRKIHTPHHRRTRKPHGILGTIWHYAWMAIPKMTVSGPPKDESTAAMSGPLRSAVGFLNEAAHSNNSDATYLLAQMNFYGNYSHPRNFRVAFDHYKRLAVNTGNGTALYMVGLMYSTGVGGAVERDQAKALLYYTFAANTGYTQAEMAAGFRHSAGISTPKNCEVASKYYKRVADKAIHWYRSGPPGGRAMITHAYRVADEVGGVYGEGASVTSAGINAITAGLNTDARAHIDDIIEYLDLMSHKGDVKASYNLGRLYYEGQRELHKNMDLAKKYFLMVAKQYWRKDGRIAENVKPGVDKIAGKAAGYLGRMYLRGEGVPQNYEKAWTWFERGVAHGDAQAQYGLGLLHLNGYHIKRNLARATDYFKAASEQDYAPAHVELGTLYLDQGTPEDLRAASHYFELAIRYGNIEAYYYLAEMAHQGIGRERSCSQSLGYYKVVAEKAEPLVSPWLDANLAYSDGDYELAFLEYLLAAEQGYERAQNNVAYMLDSQQAAFPLASLIGQSSRPPLLDDPSLALIYWTRSSRQHNIDSLVKMGDYYLQGIGTDPDVDKAAQCYHGAAEYHQSAQALYNLGWMHENGVGQPQDFHLAKRYYDFALETNTEAYLPVTLSLLKLRLRSAWNTFTHGSVNSIRDEPSPKKSWTLSEWLTNFLQDDYLYYGDDVYYDDIYDDALPGGEVNEFDDVVLGGHSFDSLVIIGLAATLVLLFYYRRVRQQQEEERRERIRRAEQLNGIVQPPVVQGRNMQQQGQQPQGQDQQNQGAINQEDFLWPAGGIGL